MQISDCTTVYTEAGVTAVGKNCSITEESITARKSARLARCLKWKQLVPTRLTCSLIILVPT